MSWCGRWLALALILGLSPDAQAQTAPVKVSSTAEGLAHFAVNRIVRDSRGLLWFCTREGLSMFAGYGFTTYRTADGLPSANITDILENPEGTYWIGTLEGLVLFDPAAPPTPAADRRRARFSVVQSPGDGRTAAIRRIVRDLSGTIWVGTSAGLFRIDESDGWRLVPVDLGIVDTLGKHMLTLQADVPNDGKIESVKLGAVSLAKALVAKLR